MRVNGAVQRLDDVPALDKKLKHNIELVVDRIVLEPANYPRLTESVESRRCARAQGELFIELDLDSGSRAEHALRPSPSG